MEPFGVSHGANAAGRGKWTEIGDF